MEYKKRKQTAINSLKTMTEVEERVVKELFRMGASYNCIGTYYIRDCIVTAINSDIYEFCNVVPYTASIKRKIAEKYSIKSTHLQKNMENTIGQMLCRGDINYILDVFKGSYDPEKGTIPVNTFILTIAEKVRLDISKEYRNADYFRGKIKECIENITDPALLNGICNIVMSLKGGVSL